MLVGMWERGNKPQLVITADVGSERSETRAFRPIFDDWLESVGFPRSRADRYEQFRPDFRGNLAEKRSLLKLNLAYSATARHYSVTETFTERDMKLFQANV